MNRETWMLPSEDRVDRSLTAGATGRGPTPARRRNVRSLSVLLVCVAATLVVAGAAFVTQGTEAEQELPDPSAVIAAPEPPFNIIGYTKDAESTPIPFCTVTITNVDSGAFVVVESSASGWYEYDLNLLGWDDGDAVHVEAVKGTLMGENDGVILDGLPFVWLDITLDVVIPEFPMVVVPVVGMLALFAIVRSRRRDL